MSELFLRIASLSSLMSGIFRERVCFLPAVCTHVDLWAAALEYAKSLSGAPGWAIASLGAVETDIVGQVETGKFYEVELTKYGVPANARVLSRNYTPQCDRVKLIETHANSPYLRFSGTTLRLLGVPLGEGPLPRAGPVAMKIVWIETLDSDEGLYLATAFEAAAAGEHAQCLVLAQSTVEVSMMPVIKQRLRLHAAADRVENFMKDSLTYSHALNVVLPYMSAELGVPKMPDAVREALNKMRKKRNDIIHEGAKVAAVTAGDAMEGLCAASFGFECMRYVRPILLEGKSRQ